MLTTIIDQGTSDNKTIRVLRKALHLARDKETLLVIDTMTRGQCVGELRRQCTNEGINFNRLRLTINIRTGDKLLMDDCDTVRNYRNVALDLYNRKVCPKLDSIIASAEVVVASAHDAMETKAKAESLFT